ncbi:MAG: sigma-70 family RNA polymerase sigma factor [Pirellulales bacterium]|nr:sigma-70 family RNA polymerase sigma factor [Pirellulales bacterium]
MKRPLVYPGFRTAGVDLDSDLPAIETMDSSPSDRADLDRVDPVRNEHARSEFVQLLTKAQLGLLRYVTALTGNPEEASNILQETNLILWEKFDEFTFGTNFEAWATKIAYWKVRAYLRDRSREKLVFSGEIVEQLAERHESTADMDSTIVAMRECLKKLRESDYDLLRLRYDGDYSIQKLSGHLGKSPSAVKGALLRARRLLRACIEGRLLHEA